MTLEANDRAQHDHVETRPTSLSTVDIIPPPNKASSEPRLAQLSSPPNVATDALPPGAATPVAGAVAGGKVGDLALPAVPCESPNPQFRGMNNTALQAEVNAIMLKDGYIFNDTGKGDAAKKLLADRGITPLAPNKKFDDEKDVPPEDKALLASLQAAKAFNNYPGKDACTSITDPNYRQRGKNELLPSSIDKDLTADDIKKLGTDGSVSMDQLRLARNEIFARGGRPFIAPDLAKFGIDQGYKPRLNYNEATDFTKTEASNAKLLLGVEGYMREHKMQKIDNGTLDSVVADLKQKQ
jgi:hypothetical protein